MRLLTATAVFALCAFSAGADDPKDAAKKLEGTYEVLELIAGGKPDPKKDDVTGVEIKDGEIVVKGKDADKAKFKLDPSKKPAHIDLMPGKDETILGIYEVKETDKGTELTLAFSHADKAERPKDFKGAGKDDMVIKLFRKKAK